MKTKTTLLYIALTILFSFKTIDLGKHSYIEKIYTQTDRPLYFPGETIWFKSYITNAQGHISTMSDYMHAELISPKGTVAKRIKLDIQQGYAYGDFLLEDDWVGGLYKVRMYTSWMQNFGNTSFFEKELMVQKVISPNLLMTLDFDKKAYGSKSKVIAHFKVNDLNNLPLKQQKFQFEVKLKGQTILSEEALTNNEGKQDISFTLPNNLKTTDVLLNVLIPHKNSKESISRSVPITLNMVDLQFFPESGNAITGINNTIAFKAVNNFGKPADISGDIVNKKGDIVTTFSSYHDGMGSFVFTPDSKSYFAKITSPFVSDSLIPLPKIKTKGTMFHIDEKNGTHILNIFSNQYKDLRLNVSNAYKTLISEQFYLTNKQLSYPLNTSKFPTGILKLSLLDVADNIVAERLLFVNKPNQLNIAITLDKSHYDIREKVKVKLKTTDADNNPIPSNLSLSVADNKLISFADDKQDNICSYLLMSSELKGKIHKPAFYFNPEEDKADKALDYVMLTHGWRNYLNLDITPENADFLPGLTDVQYGKVVDKNYKGVKCNLLLFDNNSNKVEKFETNDKGHFSLKIEKNSKLVLLAYTNDGKKLRIIKDKLVKAKLSNKQVQANNKKAEKIDEKRFKTPFKKPVKEVVKATSTLPLTLNENTSQLDEVVVVGGYYYTSTVERTGSIVKIEASKIDNPLAAMQGYISGVKITQDSGIPGSTYNIEIRGKNSMSGNSQPLVVVDGVPYTANNDHSNSFQNIDPADINSIEVLKNSDISAIYGCRGSGGVILVTTKRRNYNQYYNNKSLNNKKYKNYTVEIFNNYERKNTYYSKQFYVPVYESKTLPSTRNDFRNTIYWNPVIQTDRNGEATFEFYNSDAITSFIMTAEGIGYNGLTGRKELKYATKKTLNIDVKTPNYMAINDTINLPVVISNTSNQTITTNLNIKLPESLKALDPIKGLNLNIKPNAHDTKIIRVVPVKKAKNATLHISATNQDYSDTVNKNMTIISPYFPMQASISGSKNDSYQFNINNAIKGSLKAEFSIYTDIVGNVMDGVESLIRQPYGCFEQVSSSTYPNILVLKYLKETNKSNPEIEEKAMAFIKKGYKKLAAYETSKNGFEWYGNAPPHEALSAYGLMEFMEMKDVYNGVSEPMIKRTVNYLISRKNGNGGFKQNRGKYGFSAAPKEVNNAYIVYALSETGITIDLHKEYHYALNEALKSNDSYRMALMALASFNLNQTENAQKLMAKIKNNIAIYGYSKLPVEHTITRSYGNAKTIETTAFSILALLKQGNNDALIAQGIEFILSNRKNGRFGSTQSTSMALKALIAYTRTQKQNMVQSNSIEIKINDKTITRELHINSEGKIVLKDIANYLTSGTQHVSVTFSNPKSTFPYLLNINWDSDIPSSSPECKLNLETEITNTTSEVGETVRLNITVANKTNTPLPMATAIIGIPSGTTAQAWQLKEIVEQYKADYFEVFDNYLVFYWKEFNSKESKSIALDLKAEIPGYYQAPSSTAYLYYADEYKHWVKGNQIIIE